MTVRGGPLIALILSAAACAAAAEPPAAPPLAEGSRSDPRVLDTWSMDEGRWRVYKGTLEVREGDDEFTAPLEYALLGLGSSGEGKAPEVLLLRSGESPENSKLVFREAITLVAGPDGVVRPKLPVEDRVERTSRAAFKYLPLSFFVEPEGRRLGEKIILLRMHVLYPEPRELRCVERIASGTFTYEAEPGQKLSFVVDREELPFEVVSLRQVFSVAEAGRRSFKVKHFQSALEGRVPSGDGKTAKVEVKIDLQESEDSKLEGERWATLRSEARKLQDIERTLFVSLDSEGAQSKAAAFVKESPGSRLSAFATGLALQADDIFLIGRERRFYGKPAPDFTLKSLEGNDVTLSRLLPGKVTLLAFWAVNCTACRAEAPYLTKLHAKHRGRGFQVLAVDAYDDETREQVSAFAAKLKLTHPIVIQGGAASDLFDVQQILPTCFWIDHEGRIVRRDVGFSPAMEKEIERRIEEMLAARDAAGRTKGAP